MRFHCLGIQHTVTSKEYVACAFTQKVLKFCSMMTLRGHTVIHYGHEDSCVECTEHVTVISRDKYNAVYGDHDFHSKLFKFDQGDEVYTEFNQNAIREVNARKQSGDWLLAFWGAGHQSICQGAGHGMRVCEPGIGYPYGHFAEYKIFESYAMYHAYVGLTRVAHCVDLSTWSKEAVIPNYFDPCDFEFSSQKDDYFLFVGRIGSAKGVDWAIRMTEHLGKKLIIGGQNAEDGIPFPHPKHIEIVGHVDIETRKRLMSRAQAVICMSMFAEPFCGVHVESLMSGTPIITSDWGAMTEFNLHGITGFRCRTFEQMLEAGRRIHEIKPETCRQWALDTFSIDKVASMYEDFFLRTHSLSALVKTYPKSQIKPLRVAIWNETKWAMGRIGHAIQKYLSCATVDLWDWEKVHLFDCPWKEYDHVITKTDVLSLDLPPELARKLIVIAHCPRFDHPYFHEEVKIVDGVTYGGVSQETCNEMKSRGVSAHWFPFGADTELFPLRHAVRPIKRIGITGNPNSGNESYNQVKGFEMFREICEQVGAEPVFIYDRTPETMFIDIDAFICCSEFEAGPLGIFEAASYGVPVLTRPVGNVQHIKGIRTFTTVQEALDCLIEWSDIHTLKKYCDIVTREVRIHWSMRTCIQTYLEPVLHGNVYDFIEIGTCDFSAEVQTSDTLKGISVEPIQRYLDALPDKPGCVKVRAAISSRDGFMNMYSVDHVKYGFPDWARGCSSLGNYHPTLLRLIHERHLDEREVFMVERVPVMKFSTFIARYNIRGAKYLKIDTEGHDLEVLEGYIECLESGFPVIQKLMFESNSLIPEKSVNDMIKRLEHYGYHVTERGENTTLSIVK
jgi:FkbM family methyltransferase